MSQPPEEIIGTILYAAGSPDYDPMSAVFTDRQALKVPLSRMATLAGGGSMVAGWLAGANPSTFSALGGLVGMRQWGNLKKQVADKPVVSLERSPLAPEVFASASAKLSYDQVKEVRVSKVMMSSDQILFLSAGFLHTMKVVFDGRAVDDVKNLVRATPLAPKLKQ